MGNSVAKVLYELFGLLALCAAVFCGLFAVFFMAIELWELRQLSDYRHASYWTTMITVALFMFFVAACFVVMAFFCRRRVRALEAAGIAEETTHARFDPSQQASAFAVMSGIVGAVLIIESINNLIGEGGSRWMMGMALSSSQIPFMQFLDIALTAALGLLLFLRPHWPYRLWRRFARPNVPA